MVIRKWQGSIYFFGAAGGYRPKSIAAPQLRLFQCMVASCVFLGFDERLLLPAASVLPVLRRQPDVPAKRLGGAGRLGVASALHCEDYTEQDALSGVLFTHVDI